jgi:monovalent cation/hydrogen antiporter
MADVVEGVLEVATGHYQLCVSDCDSDFMRGRACVKRNNSRVYFSDRFFIGRNCLTSRRYFSNDNPSPGESAEDARERGRSVAEGESLLNDASSLIVFRFALVAIMTGQFQLSEAVGSFFLVITMGTVVGLLIALIFFTIHRWLPTSPSIDIVLSFLAPYCMYYFAEMFHFSGVLSVVAGGLFLSSRRHTMLSYQSRVQGSNVWSTIGFILNGMVFLLIGLELPVIIRGVEEVTLEAAIGYGLGISLVLIITRICCTLGAALFTRVAGRFITVADRNPGWKIPLVFGWAGMRGVVSLAAALSIPVMIAPGQPFPFRNLILIITFIVILVTLVFQSLLFFKD